MYEGNELHNVACKVNPGLNALTQSKQCTGGHGLVHGYVMSNATQVLFNGLNTLTQTGHCWSGISAFAGNVQCKSSATDAVSRTESANQGHWSLASASNAQCE